MNPEKRISIAEIEKHPWFLKLAYKWKNGGEGPLRSPPSDQAIKPFTGNREELDDDILNSLSILGYGTDDEIIKNLRSFERNYEKVFYWALKQRKNEFLEKYENEYDDHSRSLHRRTGSRSSVFNDRNSMSELNQSQSQLNTSTGQLPSPSSPTNRRSDVQNEDLNSRRRPASESKRKSYSPSPLSIQVGDQLKQQQQPQEHVSVDAAREKALQALQGNRASSNSPVTSQDIPQFSVSSTAKAAVTAGKKSALADQFKKQMMLDDGNPAHTSMISLPSQQTAANNAKMNNSTETSNNPVPLDKKLMLNTNVSASTPSLVVNPAWNGQAGAAPLSPAVAGLQSPNAINSNIAPQSPAIGNSPKRSWFANLFQFKPESFVFYSNLSLDRTKVRIEEYLQEVGAQYQQSKDGISLKCKYDSAGSLPPVKFRIALNFAEDERIEIMCTQQQGNFSFFVLTKLRNNELTKF